MFGVLVLDLPSTIVLILTFVFIYAEITVYFYIGSIYWFNDMADA